MTCINKQKFLAELGKLLTFMYEEDRQRALAMYSQMFDQAADEQALLQALVSPTRQAVIVARAYNSNLGKLSVYSESKAEAEDLDENGVPDYVQAIDGIREEAFAAQNLRFAPAAERAQTEQAQTEPEEPEENKDQMTLFADTQGAAEEDAGEAEETEPEEPEEPEAEEAEETEEEEPEAEEAEAEPAGETAEAEEETAEADRDEKKAESEITYFTMPKEGTETPRGEDGAPELEEDSFNIDTAPLKQIKRKPRILLLILYIILAIPVAVVGIVLLLIPAILFLALSVGAIIVGVVLVSAAFQGLAILADIMVVLGVALVLFALGLLFLWTSIWFIGGAIPALVRGLSALCDKWCYKEVLI